MNERQARQNQASAFATKKRVYAIVEFVIICICLMTAFLLSSPVVSWVDSLNSFLAAAVYFLIFSSAFFIILFPIQYIKKYVLPKDFGQLKQSFSGWLSSYIGSVLLVVFLGAVAFGLLHILIAASVDWWWIWVALMVAVFSLIYSTVFPFLLPIMYKRHPLPNGSLKDELNELIVRSKVEIAGIDVLEVSVNQEAANAMVLGFGKTRRLAFNDTLIDRYNDEEVKVICAHELGHVKKSHFMKTWFFSLIIIMLVFWLTNVLAGALINLFDAGDVATLSAMPIVVLVFFVVFSLLMIVSNYYSRHQEKEADLYSLKMTKTPQAFIAALQKATDQNLEEETPHPFIEKLVYSYPSSASRQALAERYMKESENEV